jgi:hypothetical protein
MVVSTVCNNGMQSGYKSFVLVRSVVVVLHSVVEYPPCRYLVPFGLERYHPHPHDPHDYSNGEELN